MYERKALHVWHEGDDDAFTDKPCDARESQYPSELPGPIAYLDHSCDYWVIGGLEQVLAMVADLVKVADEMEERLRGGKP